MKLSEIKNILSAQFISKNKEDIEILAACGADLMSDVLAFTKEKSLLLTGLTNPQVIRTAEMIDLSVVIFVRGKIPPQETVNLAEQKEIPLLVTDKALYEACGLLYKHGLKSEKLSKLK